MSDYFSQDLQRQILKNLPVKTLLRCRCVSKSWKQLIASKSFIEEHHALQTRRILIQNRDLSYLLFDPQTLPSFEFDTLKCPITVECSRRHLITFSTVNGIICVYDNADTHCLFNPSIRRHFTIPIPELLYLRNSKFSVNYCGFWMDPPTNDFKVVLFCFKPQIAFLYSPKEQSWTKIATITEISMNDIGDPFFSDDDGDVDVDEFGYCVGFGNFGLDSRSPQVTIDGVAHWTALDWSGDETTAIVSFDFEQHEFGIIKLPVDSIGTEKYLFKWKDMLSVWQCSTYWREGWCHIWVMQNGSWTVMSRLYLHPDINRVFFVLGSSGKVLASNYTGGLMVYDEEEGFIYLPAEIRPRIYGLAGLSHISFDFVESLFFPDGNCISSY